MACLMLKVAHERPLDRYQRKIEKLATQWPTAWHLVCLAEDKCRFEHFNRLKSRIEFDISLGRAAPHVWDAGSPWSAIFLKAAKDDETCWDDNIRHLAMSWLAHGGRGVPKSREQLVAEAALAGGMAALVPRDVSPSRDSELFGSRHYDQGNYTPEQEGKASGVHSRREERSWASTRKEVKGQERRKGKKEQKSALHTRSRRCTVVFQLEFRWWDMWRAFTRKPMSGGQNSQMHHVSVRQALGKEVSTDLTRSRNGRNGHSGRGFSILVCARRRMFDFPALFFGFGEIRAGRAISAAAARRGIMTLTSSGVTATASVVRNTCLRFGLQENGPACRGVRHCSSCCLHSNSASR